MSKCFIDTNLVVYANDRSSGKKQARAIEVIATLMRLKAGAVSIQVLQEYANVALTKLKQESAIVLRQIKLLESLIVVVPTPDMVRRSIEIRNAYPLSFWDASIVAAAESEGCPFLLSEDLNADQYYSTVQVLNPFVPTFELADLLN